MLVAPHLTKEMVVKKRAQTTKPKSALLDPLHLHPVAYQEIANVVNEVVVTHSDARPRSRKRKVIYEGEPAPPPRVAWAMARRKQGTQET